MSEASAGIRTPLVTLAIAVGMALVATAFFLLSDWIWTHTDTVDDTGVNMLYIGSWVLYAWAAIVAIFAIVHFGRLGVSHVRRSVSR
ncbi:MULTISPECIES: hypothetical protein [unclassified Microbacterium]|uniref:hypothetical protein n=1 Tax=unclassified Microbacterium TaxID=2609290 RepID=UPI000AF62999|nr:MULTISPECIES: hypothetical protein [unclassified Microbacterium]MBN9216216.1 hypothetical protein [Microbacterium sp.]